MVRYVVVRNDEHQYSIWAAHRPLPSGWTDTGHAGTEEECLEVIAELWTDLRPRSLRTEELPDGIGGNRSG